MEECGNFHTTFFFTLNPSVRGEAKVYRKGENNGQNGLYMVKVEADLSPVMEANRSVRFSFSWTGIPKDLDLHHDRTSLNDRN